MRKFAPLILVAVATVSWLSIGYAASKVVVVNLDDALDRTVQGQAAQSALLKARAAKNAEVAAASASLEQKKQELLAIRRRHETIPPAKFDAFQQQALDFQQLQQRAVADLSDTNKELYSPLERRMKDLLRTITNAEGYDFVITKISQVTVYHRKDIDLTDRIVQEYNRLYPGASASASATAPSASASAPTPSASSSK